MGLRVDAHAAHQVVHLEALAGSDDVRHLGGLRLVHRVEQHPRHPVGRGRSVAGRAAELGLVALHELPRHRGVGGVVEVRADPDVLADLGGELDELLHARGPRHDERDLRGEPEVEDLARAGDRVEAEVDHDDDVRLVARRLGHVVGKLALAERVPVRAHELDPVRLAHFLDVLLHRPPEGIVGHQEVPALGLGIGLHEGVHDRLGRGVRARRPLERIAVTARARDVLGAAAEVVEDLLPLGHLGDGQRDARGPGPDDVLHAVGVHRLLGPARGAARLGLVVAGDVLDGLALDLHAALVQRQLHPTIEHGAHIGERAGEGPEAQHGHFLCLGPQHGGKAEPRGRGGGAAQFQHVPSSEFAHDRSSALGCGSGPVPGLVAGGRIGPGRLGVNPSPGGAR